MRRKADEELLAQSSKIFKLAQSAGNSFVCLQYIFNPKTGSDLPSHF
jgi:hypothetical protein